MPLLSKSRYIAARQCNKRLWLSVHQRELAAKKEAGAQSLIDMGGEVGRAAHALFPGGVLVDESSAQFDAAAARTSELIADTSVPAIFEAAFEHGGVRIRVDVFERLADGAFGLREVKSSTRVKEAHEADVAIQLWVLHGLGFTVPSVEVIRINRKFTREAEPIDWQQFFVSLDLTVEATAALSAISDEVEQMHATLKEEQAPDVEPGSHCNKPHQCQFWAHCSAGKPAPWFIENKSAKPEVKARWLQSAKTGETWASSSLAQSLAAAEPDVWYLDFEAFVPAMPLYEGTVPYQALPFQWSLHHLAANGAEAHYEFLASGDKDPRRETAESLLEVLSGDIAPIVVYSNYENQVLTKMAQHSPDLAAALKRLRLRLFDLLPAVRNGVYEPSFAGSFSIKKVGPALAPHVTYDDLGDVAEGVGAASAFAQIVNGIQDTAEEERLRGALLAYCERDTFALMEVHKAMRTIARTHSP